MASIISAIRASTAISLANDDGTLPVIDMTYGDTEEYIITQFLRICLLMCYRGILPINYANKYQVNESRHYFLPYLGLTGEKSNDINIQNERIIESINGHADHGKPFTCKWRSGLDRQVWRWDQIQTLQESNDKIKEKMEIDLMEIQYIIRLCFTRDFNKDEVERQIAREVRGSSGFHLGS